MWHSASYLSSVCWFLRLHLLNSIQRSRHMTHHFFREDFPITSAENELVFFFFFPWVTYASRLSLHLRWWPCCWSSSGSLHTLCGRLGASSSPPLAPLTATSWPSWCVSAAWLGASPALRHHHDAEGPYGFCDWGLHWLCLQHLAAELLLSPKYSSSFYLFCHYNADLIMLYCNSLLIFYCSNK